MFGLFSHAQSHIPIPTQAQLKWQNAELAALVSWDMHELDNVFIVNKNVLSIAIKDRFAISPPHQR